jgi:hypothetical protein
MGQNARATTQERRQGPSTTQVAANKTDRESPRIRIRGGDPGSPKEPQQRAPVYDTKATATPLHPQREDNMAGTRDAQTAPQFHHQTTATTQQSEQSLPTKRTAPRHVNRCGPNTKRQRTHTQATKTEDANARHEPTTKVTGEAHRRALGHEPNRPRGGHPAAQDQRPEGRPNAGRETTNAQKTATETSAGRSTPAPEQTTRGAQQAQENRGTGTQSMRRPPSPTSTKNTGKAEKTRKQGQNRW